MPALNKIGDLAPAGTVGNNTHAGVKVADKEGWSCLAALFEVEAAGATPTVTVNFQATLDEDIVTDANADWFSPFALPHDGAAEIAMGAIIKTAAGVYVYTYEFTRRPFRRIRIVTSANTNITYNGRLYAVSQLPY